MWIEAACELSGKSKAMIGRYYSNADAHGDRPMPIDVIAALEVASSFPHATSALADLRGITRAYDLAKRNPTSQGINSDVVALSPRFAMLMGDYNLAISDGGTRSTRPADCCTKHCRSNRFCWK